LPGVIHPIVGVADSFRARVVEATHESLVFEVAGASTKMHRFVDLMRPQRLVELVRTSLPSLVDAADHLSPRPGQHVLDMFLRYCRVCVRVARGHHGRLSDLNAPFDSEVAFR
jgi:hypothetical protein